MLQHLGEGLSSEEEEEKGSYMSKNKWKGLPLRLQEEEQRGSGTCPRLHSILSSKGSLFRQSRISDLSGLVNKMS